MKPHIELKKFTELSAEIIGGRLHEIVGNNSSWMVLKRDFTNLRAYYGRQRRATRSVKERQYQMRQDPGYVAMAVLADSRLIGVTSFLQMDIPYQPNCAGPNLALWLNPARPAELRRLGPEIMQLRLEYLLNDPIFTGHIWSVIRPDNLPSLRIWEKVYDDVGFMKLSEPSDYETVDGISTPRILFASVYTLEQLRRRR